MRRHAPTRLRPARVMPGALALGAALLVGACGPVTPEAPPSSPADVAAARTSTSSAPAPPAPQESGVDAPAVDDQSTDVPVSGQYVDLATYRADPAAYAGTKVVLFFHASWCPQCREVEQSLTSAPVPAGLTVVKVDYDTQTHLRRTYGVTIQHTFVQVDPSDPSQAALATWSVATTADQILAKTV